MLQRLKKQQLTIVSIVLLCAALTVGCLGAKAAWAENVSQATNQSVSASNESQNNDNESAGEPETRSINGSGNTVNVNQMPDSSFLYDTDIAELAGAEAFHEAQTVQVRGEVVGDCINDETDPNLCWITLQSLKENSDSSVSILMSHEQASLIDTYGSYSAAGTELQVRGVFHLSCAEHQGLSDLHAQEVSVLHAGEPVDHPVRAEIMWVAVLFGGLGLLTFFIYQFLRERRK